MRLPLSLCVAALVLCLGLPVRAAPPPKVVASLKPIHSLVAGVMAGVGTPRLLVGGALSPHTYALRPSDARALGEADLVFWVGGVLETFMVKPLQSLGGKARVVTLLDVPGMTVLPAREGGVWEADGHGHGHDHDHDEGATADGHLWLDVDNARRIVAAAAAALIERDPERTATYRANAERLDAELGQLDTELRARLTPVKDRPFVVFHDAYQYVEARYGLAAAGAITVSPDRRPGAKRLRAIRSRITRLGAVCVFTEPPFEPTLVATIVEGTAARRGELDPEGAGLDAGPALYPQLMRNLADALRHCLAGG